MTDVVPPSSPSRQYERPTLWRSFRKQRGVLNALMIRDVINRYGHENLGFFWLMGEPLLLTLGVMVMWTLVGLHHGDGIGIVPLALTGYTMLTLWRHVVAMMIGVISTNSTLLYHRNIRFFDLFLAKIVLESIGGLSAFFIGYLPLYLLGYIDLIEDPLLLVGAWVLMTLFAFSFGLILASLSEMFEAAAHFIQPIMYITLPLTGAFYMVAWLPQAVQKVVVWSPMVNCFEMFRAGLFGSKLPTYWDAYYVLICSIMLLAVGVPLVMYVQKHIKTD